MDPSRALLNAFLNQHSEAAFRDLVEREMSFVYGTALRRTGGDEAISREITQVVFIDLARKAAAVPREMAVAGWLHRHTGFVAARMLRAEQRRRQREHTAAMDQNSTSSEDAALWQDLAPLLDDLLERLPSGDRDAVILRCLEGRGLREVGISLGVSENTARMRVSRALEKLRQSLQHRGVTSTTMALTAALALAPRVQAPESWAGPVAGLALRMAPAPALATSGVLGMAGNGVLLVKGTAVLVSAMLIGGGAFLYETPRHVEEGSGSLPEKAGPPAGRLSDWRESRPRQRPDDGGQRAQSPPPAPQALITAAAAAVPVPRGSAPASGRLTLGVKPAAMKFDPEILTVRAGQAVTLHFQNAACPLQHNFVLAKPGTLKSLGAIADKMLTDPRAMEQFYLPASPDVVVQSTRLVGFGQSDLIEFTAPAAPGDYPYLCTFPGHWRIMNGIMRVLP